MAFTTKPQGVWANFTTTCATCGSEITVTNGRTDHPNCRTHPDWSAAMKDYYDAGAKGAPPKHPLDNRT